MKNCVKQFMRENTLVKKVDVRVAVHGGETFHPDELLYIALLRLIYGDEHVAYDRLGRGVNNFSSYDYVADIGCRINVEKVSNETVRVFHDHHGKACERFREHHIRMNSFGMLCEMMFTPDFLTVLKREILDAVEIKDNMQHYGNGPEDHQLDGMITSPYEFVFQEERTLLDKETSDFFFEKTLLHVEKYLEEDLEAIAEELLTGKRADIAEHTADAESVERLATASEYVRKEIYARAENPEFLKDGILIVDGKCGPCKELWSPVIAFLRGEGKVINFVVFQQYEGRSVVYAVNELMLFPEPWVAVESDHKEIKSTPVTFCHTAGNFLVTDTLEHAMRLAKLAS